MSQPDPNRRFQDALDRARVDWARADPARCAALAGCVVAPDGVIVPYFGMRHRVTHPAGEVFRQTETGDRPAHASIVIVVLHYLLTADGTLPADRWIAFRELPDGLFYAQAFAGHAEGLLASRFTLSPVSVPEASQEGTGQNLEAFRRAALALGGTPLALADASFRFQAFPCLPVAVLVWEGDEEFAGQARVLFDANAGHYLPTEDLSGIGDWLAHRLIR